VHTSKSVSCTYSIMQIGSRCTTSRCCCSEPQHGLGHRPASKPTVPRANVLRWRFALLRLLRTKITRSSFGERLPVTAATLHHCQDQDHHCRRNGIGDRSLTARRWPQVSRCGSVRRIRSLAQIVGRLRQTVLIRSASNVSRSSAATGQESSPGWASTASISTVDPATRVESKSISVPTHQE